MNSTRAPFTLTVIGIDPGIETSHAAVITVTHPAPATMTAYGPRVTLIGTHEGAGLALITAAALSAPDAAVVVVEVARGTVRGKVDADPILHVNIKAGELIGAAGALGLPVTSVASGGDATPWNWRTSLGVKGVSGAPARDGLVSKIVRMRLSNPEALPVGVRGAQITHYNDAAGLAMATADRIMASPGLPPLEALERVTPLEALKQQAKATRKRAMRAVRAAS